MNTQCLIHLCVVQYTKEIIFIYGTKIWEILVFVGYTRTAVTCRYMYLRVVQ